MELFVARQPIFDAHLNVFAYELLFRSGLANKFDGTEENLATSKVITAVFYSPGGEKLLGGKPAFINFPRNLLLQEDASILPPQSTVVEVLETVVPEPEVIEACSRLRSRGYRLALDDFVDSAENAPLTNLADFIKVDIRATPKAEQQELAKRYGGRAKLLAEKVETREEFEETAAMGYSYFQGYFFAKPVIMATREIPGFKLNFLRILQEIHQPELDLKKLTTLASREPSLCYKLLRFVNSALFNVRTAIESIEQALVFIGENGTRKWLSVVTLVDLASDKPAELVANALVRARFCELLAPVAHMQSRGGDLFLVGMFSRLDAMLGRPLPELLDGMQLADEVRATLLGTAPANSPLSGVWNLVLAYEAADWAALAETAKSLKVSPAQLPDLYTEAVKWSDEIFRS